uniref:Uncharacterized protein n=1 Tax=Arundo donax TaxID=35708 RepID=A0A0A9DJ74_ARUDO
MCTYLSSQNLKMGSRIPNKRVKETKLVRITRKLLCDSITWEKENQSRVESEETEVTCKRRNASLISSTVSPLFSRKDRLWTSDEATTLGCFRKPTAL